VRVVTAGILLAAGESTRMGQLKALLPWRGITLIQAQLGEMTAAELSPLLVVLGHRASELRELLPASARVVINERFRDGKSTSIVAGVSALPDDADAAVVIAVDQPTSAEVIRALLMAHSSAHSPLSLPSVNMHRGHPTLFDRALFPELRDITEEHEGLREVMLRHDQNIRYVDVDDEIVRANLNSPADYEAAFARWGRPG
jgi:molybdenum cofactor cytidylyltransferase